MTLNTASVATATAPTFIGGFLKHFLWHRSEHKDLPTKQLSYDEGLKIVRKFLQFASTHTLAELQHFTGNHVPVPRYVVRTKVTVPEASLDEAARVLIRQLARDPDGIAKVGGVKWWQMRGIPLMGEWIEMKRDVVQRGGKQPDRVILYVHGGAYFFSSLETHRYQAQRHARKLGARAFTPAYRLAPQYPFPCGLLDILASYLFLIDPPEGASHSAIPPSKIIVSGDSAGAGAILSLLCILRDQGLPLPAGATLISPWVDLAHSFPSLMADDSGDYIPSDGFHYRPGLAWPPIKGDAITVSLADSSEQVVLDEQIQMYCPNTLLNHPLVSPINQGSLGGLPPMMIIGGSSELLRDEIMYLAHKAASPADYQPSPATEAAYPISGSYEQASDFPPTQVHLSMYDHTAHVTPTLSVTRPAKFMYRGVANFGLWALTTAAKRQERHERHAERRANGGSSGHPSRAGTQDSSRTTTTTRTTSSTQSDSIDSLTSRARDHLHIHSTDGGRPELINHDSEDESDLSSAESGHDDTLDVPGDRNNAQFVRVTGREPPFVNHMVRERVSPYGVIRPMEPVEQLEACRMPRDQVGVVHAGPVRKWLAKRAKWDSKFAKDHEKFRRLKEEDRRVAEANGFLDGMFKGERPPLCSLAGFSSAKLATEAGESVDETGKSVNQALAMWSRISGAPDEKVLGHAEEDAEDVETAGDKGVSESEGGQKEEQSGVEAK